MTQEDMLKNWSTQREKEKKNREREKESKELTRNERREKKTFDHVDAMEEAQNPTTKQHMRNHFIFSFSYIHKQLCHRILFF